MRLSVPNLSTSNALQFSKSLANCDLDDSYIFDFSKVSGYEPLPMLLTAAAIRQFCTDRFLDPTDCHLYYNDDKNYHYACHMGFFQAAGFALGKLPGEAMGSTTYIPITKLNIAEMTQRSVKEGRFVEQGEIIETEAMRLSRVLSQGQKEFQKLFQYLIREAIRNIPEHAETNDVWLCGQYWPSRDLAKIAILDEGIGVFNSLSRNRIHGDYIKTNEEALRWALKPGVSVSFDPARGQRSEETWANSGFGLYMISEICKLTHGWLTFVSGDDCLRVFPNDSSIYPAHYNGTALGIRVKPSKIVKCQAMINRARTKGEQEARTIRNAFKKASVPSKGLLLH